MAWYWQVKHESGRCINDGFCMSDPPRVGQMAEGGAFWMHVTPLYAAPQAAAQPDAYNRKLRQQLEQEWADLHALRQAAAQAPVAQLDLTSPVLNEACWKFIETMPHRLPGAIFNDLKPAMKAAFDYYLTAAAAPQAAEPVQAPSMSMFASEADYAAAVAAQAPEGGAR